jgi:hypothetical protein
LKTGTKSIVYILFASVADKIRASDLSGYVLIDRGINIQPAQTGNFARKYFPSSEKSFTLSHYAVNDSHTGFVYPIVGKKSNKKFTKDNDDSAPTRTSPPLPRLQVINCMDSVLTAIVCRVA